MCIAVVGSIHADFYIKTKKFPQPDETVIGNDFAIHPGGKGANQAVGCARLGIETYMIGAVGNDYIGRLLIENLAKNGIKVDYIFTAECSSGVAFIILNEETGENMIIVSSGADNALTPNYVEDVLENLKNRARTLLVQLEIPIETVYKAIEIAKEMGMTTILNPAPARSLDRYIYSYIDVIVPNRVELQQLTNIKIATIDDVFKASEELLNYGCNAVVTTLGSMGAAVVTPSIRVIVPAFKTQIVDTVGAGDAFVAGLAVSLYENRDIVEAVKYANATAALKIMRMGAQSMPTRSEVEEFLKEYSQNSNEILKIY
ncbi:MAG: ribokinase [Ignisphaera sp.]